MRRSLFGLCLALAIPSQSGVPSSGLPIRGGLPVYLTLEGVPGGMEIPGREGTIEVGDIDWRVFLPVDAADGSITGTRKHSALTFVKNPDRSSPVLFGKVCTGESIPKATFTFYEITSQGEERPFYQLILLNVKVTALNSYNPGSLASSHAESVSLRYEKISAVYLDGNLIQTDDWNSR